MHKTCKQLRYWNEGERRVKHEFMPQTKSTSVRKVACFDGVQRLNDFVLNLLNGSESTSKQIPNISVEVIYIKYLQLFIFEFF